jgi:dTDP-4-dehydrorhamnose reductase
MRILVTGRDGQVARALAERSANHGHTLIFAGRPELDLSEPETIRDTVARIAPDVVVSVAAYTAVDKAEEEEALAMRINGEGPGHLAEAARKIGARIIHLSTDYVFDGSGDRPWREDDPAGPLGAYGRSKLAGEAAVRQAAPDHHLILRTAWVYSPFGANFVNTMLRLAETRDEVRVVDDQFGNPTSALDIADAVLAICDRWEEDPATGSGQTCHLAGTGQTNWAGFASHVFDVSARFGGPSARVTGIPTSDFPTPARRPANSRLDTNRFAETFGWRAPEWRGSVEKVVRRLLDERT